MSGKKLCSSFPQKFVKALAILILTMSGGMIPTPEAYSQEASPQPSSELIQSWKNYLKNYPAVFAQYQREQQIDRQAAKPVIAVPGEKDIDDLVKTYPFLREDLENVKDLQQKEMAYQKNHPSDPPIDASPHLQIAESNDKKTGINIFFLSKSGQIWCGAHGCNMDVYVDTGTGYQKAGSFIVASDIYISRINKNIFLFDGPPQDPKIVEWLLKDHKFVEITPPQPEPDSALYRQWRAGHPDQ